MIWAEAAAPSQAQAAALRDRLAEKLPAASQAEAWYRMAAMALAREDAGRDEEAISNAFRHAGELGHPQAMRRLALRYLEGTGVERDWAAAASWLRRAAEAGNTESGLAYAAMVFAGEGVRRDPAAALPWARRAAEAGIAEAPKLVAAIERALAAAADPLTPRQSPPPATPPAAPAAGKAPAAPGPQDLPDETARIPAGGVVAADPLDAMGQTALGLDYYFGRNGRPRDLTSAAKWLLRAANNGSLAAQHNISVMYAHGQGLRIDPLEGARWCRIAAERGDQRSQFRLSYLFFHGQGVARDPLEALFWAELAARQGHRGALTARDGLAAKMTPQQIAEVRHRAEAFRPRA